MSLTLNLYVNNYEKKSPISLLRLPFSSFIPFSKADKWTKGVWRVLSILLSLIDSKPFAYSRGCMKDPKDMHMYLRFGSDWLGWNLITNENKWTSPYEILRVAYLLWSLLIHHHDETTSVITNTDWLDTSIFFPWKSNILSRPFYTWVFTGYPMSKKWEHRDPYFV